MLFLRALVCAALAIAGLIQPAMAEQIGPSFDCRAAHQPLAQILCADTDLSRTDLRFAQAYFALLPQLDDAGKRDLKQEDLRFIDAVQQHCGIPSTGPTPAQTDALRKCVKDAYESQRSVWVLRLRPPYSEEASRPIEHHIALQRMLQQLGFLRHDAAVDGVYGLGTREAISRWQSAHNRSATGVLGDAEAQALEEQASQERVPVTAAATSDARLAEPSGKSLTKSPVDADASARSVDDKRIPDTQTGVGGQTASPQETRLTDKTESSAPEALAADFLASKTNSKLLVPLGNLHYIFFENRLKWQDNVDAAAKANLVRIRIADLGDQIVSPMPEVEKYKSERSDFLLIPYGTYRTTITKTEEFSEKLREFKVLLGTWQISFGPEYQKIAQFLPADKIVCKSGNFQMLLSRDSFPDAKWQYETTDVGCTGRDLTTHTVNDRLPK
jgi:hypothetical protein